MEVSLRIQLDKTVRMVTTAVRESFHELAYIRTARRVADENDYELELDLDGLSQDFATGV